MELNSGQRYAFDSITDLLINNDQVKGATLVGEGGTGKTFTTMYLVEAFLKAGLTVLLTAPTNKAVKQMEKAAREHGMDMNRLHFKTTHSAQGLSLLPDEDRKFASQVRGSILPMYDIVGIDEGSMLSRVMIHSHLLPELHASDAKFKLLIIGDNMQLPPVKESESLAFGLFETFELTQNERILTNADGSPNGIKQLTVPLRAAIKDGGRWSFQEIPANNVIAMKDAQFKKYVVDQFDKDTDLDEVRVLSWRNFRVDELNRAIREKVYGKDAAMYEIGERIVTGAPIKDPEGEIILSTDEECIVSAVTESYVTDEHTNEEYKTIQLALRPIHADVGQVFAHVVHPSAEQQVRDRLAALKARAEKAQGQSRGLAWRRWHEFQEMFANIRYCYCITVHRCQGSTYRHAIVDVKDIMENPKRSERMRLLYVAFSRPRELLSINKTGFII